MQVVDMPVAGKRAADMRAVELADPMARTVGVDRTRGHAIEHAARLLPAKSADFSTQAAPSHCG